jgi:hypothetical protein
MSGEMPTGDRPSLDRHEKMTVGVVVERRKLNNPWQDYAWRPIEVVPGAPATAPWTVMRDEGTSLLLFAGTFTMELHPRDTMSYRTNLELGASIYVVLRPDSGQPYGLRIEMVTPSPYDAEAYMEGGTDVVDKVPMPEVIVGWLVDYVAAFHVEEEFKKRRRDKPRQAREPLE